MMSVAISLESGPHHPCNRRSRGIYYRPKTSAALYAAGPLAQKRLLLCGGSLFTLLFPSACICWSWLSVTLRQVIGLTHRVDITLLLEKRVHSRLNAQCVFLRPASSDDICQVCTLPTLGTQLVRYTSIGLLCVTVISSHHNSKYLVSWCMTHL